MLKKAKINKNAYKQDILNFPNDPSIFFTYLPWYVSIQIYHHHALTTYFISSSDFAHPPISNLFKFLKIKIRVSVHYLRFVHLPTSLNLSSVLGAEPSRLCTPKLTFFKYLVTLRMNFLQFSLRIRLEWLLSE